MYVNWNSDQPTVFQKRCNVLIISLYCMGKDHHTIKMIFEIRAQENTLDRLAGWQLGLAQTTVSQQWTCPSFMTHQAEQIIKMGRRCGKTFSNPAVWTKKEHTRSNRGTVTISLHIKKCGFENVTPDVFDIPTGADIQFTTPSVSELDNLPGSGTRGQTRTDYHQSASPKQWELPE